MFISPKAIVIGFGLVTFGILEQTMPFFEPNRKPFRHFSFNFGLGLFNAIVISSTIVLLLNSGWSYRLTHPELSGISILPEPFAFILSFLLLDLYLYLWHRAMHRWGWRIHRLHHTDRHLNLSTAYRFNPMEVLSSQLLRTALVFGVGIMPLPLLVYEICFSLSLLFHHSNWHLPVAIDRRVSRIIITPNLHRLHHSQSSDHHPCNFSSILTLWDLLGCTHRYPKHPQYLRPGTRS